MEQFGFYFALGWEHILSISALDHILFIACLAITFLPNQWRNLLILLTAFTIGHSITLVLNVFSVIEVSEYWVEILIPVTIIITALVNITTSKDSPKKINYEYFLALFFGLIHGLAYASSLRFMLADSETIAVPLFAFNVGIEGGQIIVAAFMLMLSYLIITINIEWFRYWVIAISIVAVLTAAYLVIERI